MRVQLGMRLGAGRGASGECGLWPLRTASLSVAAKALTPHAARHAHLQEGPFDAAAAAAARAAAVRSDDAVPVARLAELMNTSQSALSQVRPHGTGP